MTSPAAAVAPSAAGELPARTAPAGLAGIDLPADEGEVRALFGRLPAEVAGEARARPFVSAEVDRLRASYGADGPLGPPLVVQALDIAAGDFYPADWTAGQVIALMASGRTDLELEGFGRDGDLVWVRATTTVGAVGGPGTPAVARTLHTLAWGDAAGRWLFGVAAFDPEGRDALVAAFVAAAGGTPVATPGVGAG